jgi:hypothetical protein
VFVLAIAFVIRSVYSALETVSPAEFLAAGRSHWPLVVVAFILMPLNWWAEALKWQILTRPYTQLNQKEAFRAVLKGIFLGFVTPNRLGDLGGKVASVPIDKSGHATGSFLLGSMAQGAMTLWAGALAILFGAMPDSMRAVEWPLIAGAASGAVLLTLLVFAGKVPRWLLSRLNKHPELPGHLMISRHRALAVLGLSALRYVVFSGQFVLCLQAFGAEAGARELLAGVAVVYLLTSFIPSAVMGELGIREGAAILVLAEMSGPGGVLIATAASLCLWHINLLIPGLIGGRLFIHRPKTQTARS